jgi:hypothetical protein
MDCDVMVQIEQLQALNARLLQQAKDESWETFVEEAEDYSHRLKMLCEVDLSGLEETVRMWVMVELGSLLQKDEQLMGVIRGRMSMIRSDVSAMRKSSASAKAYLSV